MHTIDCDGRRHGVSALIPDEERMPLVRAWLAMVELTRHDAAPMTGDRARTLFSLGCDALGLVRAGVG